MRLIQLKLLIVFIFSGSVYAGDSSDFEIKADSYCNSSDCVVLGEEMKAAIESEVKDILSRDVDTLDLNLIPRGNRASVVLVRPGAFDFKKDVNFIAKAKLGLHLDRVDLTPGSSIEVESTGNMMAFRLKPGQSKTYYFAANTYISKSKAEDNTSSILMNSIGIGTVRSKNYIVEVGFLKLPRTGYTKEAMKKPDGLIFILRSIF